MKFSTRELVLLAVFGALWGAVEVSLGAVLHAIHAPMAGSLLAGIGIMIALIGRLYVPRRGATLFIGIIAMVLKLFSIGSVVVGPMVGILAEALVAELVLSSTAKPGRLTFLLAGGLAVLWTLVQPFFTGLVIFGREIFVIWLDLLDEGQRLFGLPQQAALWIVLILAGVRFAIGVVAGWLAWNAGILLRRRLSAAEHTNLSP
jgi:ABC-type thiamin/hydroxymethylpyrimidine transport system permease subunit